MTTPTMTPLPIGPTPKQAWIVRAAYIGTVVIITAVMVLIGLGAHIYRWEGETWGGLTLFWVFMWSYQVSAAVSWREAYFLAHEANWHPPRVIVLEDKPQDIQQEQGK